MSDYIKRENALSTFSNAFYAGLAAKIKAIPSADVAPVRHGKWEYIPPSVTLNSCYACTACGYVRFEHFANTYRYCPNCGARMDEAKEDA